MMAVEQTGLGSLLSARAPLVGRDDEVQTLEQALAAVRAGQTRLCTILGPAGIGKTRLVQDFILREREKSESPVKVFRGSARDTATSYGMFARLLRQRFGLVEGMDEEQAK